MSLLKEIPDKGAVLAWSPVNRHRNIIALGTKDSAGVGFDDYGGTLELHQLDFSDPHDYSSSLLSTAQIEARFNSLAWSDMSPKFPEFEHGVIAGGMLDGSIQFWDATKLVNGDDNARMASIQQHNGSVTGLQFNPHGDNCHLLASGGSDGEVFVTSIERPEEPNVFIPAPGPNSSKHTAEITKVAWNTQVQHILASGAQNGSCIVWDLRQKKAWCELKDPQQGTISDIAWNPAQGLHLVTAMGDDRNPVIKLWDLRSSTSLPLATLQGHTQGVLSVSWCPSDPSLLMSCGKDNKTLLWDLFHLEPVYELPSFAADQHADSTQVFGGAMGAGGAGRRYHVEWSPKLPAVLSACSFDRRVQIFSLTGTKSTRGRAPTWLRRPVGASFGFGGKLATFNNATTAGQNRSGVAPVLVQSVEDSPEVVAAAEQFEHARQSGAFKEWCDSKAASGESGHSQQVWRLMKVLCFETNAREQLLAHLGFDAQAIAAEAARFIEERHELNEKDEAPVSSGGSTGSPRADAAAESTIRRTLMVGNFQAAVDACFESGMMAEALLLASCGGAELWSSTQAKYFEREARKRPFLHLLSAIIKTDLSELVQNSDLSHWQETLAVLSTYAKTEEFGPLCAQLGKRLDAELSDKASAVLCYMCAVDIRQTALYWIDEFKEACARAGMLDTMALQDFVEKVMVFRQADLNADLGPECSEMFVQYAELIASQGKLDIAAKYAIGNAQSIAVLKDRLYHGGAAKAGMERPPCPYETKVIGGPAATSPTVAARAGATTAGGPVRKTGGAAAAAHAAAQSKPSAAGMAAASAAQTMHASTATQPIQPVAGAAAGGPTMPPGWIMMVEPNSGRPYFVNQATGVSQWEPPAGATFPQQPAVHQPAAAASVTPTQSFGGATGAAFGAAAEQFPHSTAGTAPFGGNAFGTKPAEIERKEPEVSPRSVTPTAAAAAAVTPTPASPTNVAVSEDARQIVDPLQFVLDRLGSGEVTLGGMERKQLPEIQKSLSLLTQRLSAGHVAGDIVEKVTSLGQLMHSREYHAADSIVQDLVTNAWAQHKDWVKGVKFLLQLASKKL